ncbi:hypothetical protein EPN18_00470 [bacterium]|nr:MAG: hypothetical protein EPN18_00470 [bacterium]
MHNAVRPVAIGFILGIMSLFFGIFWAVYLVVNHDAIHKTLEASANAAISSKFVAVSQEHVRGHTHANAKSGHAHEGHSSVSKDDTGAPGVLPARHEEGSKHDNPLMEAAHDRLTRGHIHAMGLGLIVICVSLVLVLLDAPARAKTIASACLGVGGFFYPFAWIIMGYRTVVMGAGAAQESVLPIVALSVPLVLIGLLICFFYLVKAVFTRA